MRSGFFKKIKSQTWSDTSSLLSRGVCVLTRFKHPLTKFSHEFSSMITLSEVRSTSCLSSISTSFPSVLFYPVHPLSSSVIPRGKKRRKPNSNRGRTADADTIIAHTGGKLFTPSLYLVRVSSPSQAMHWVQDSLAS